MGWWQVSADTLAGSRFAISPLAETTAALITLVRGTAAHPQERAWLDAHLPAFRAMLAADPVAAALVEAGIGPRWISGVFTQPPAGSGERSFDDEAELIRALPRDAALADLTIDTEGHVPEILAQSHLPERAFGVIHAAYHQAVAPDWPRRRRILEADVVARTTRLAQGGWSAALAGMRKGMGWLGEGRLRINAYDYPPREISGAELYFVPVTQAGGWASWTLPPLQSTAGPERYAIMYPCSGALAGTPAPVPESLSALLGPARARVLVLLDSPKSTTQLVALTGQALGSVGRHLKVLHEAGLVDRSRAGRSVLYYQSSAGATLIAVQARTLSKKCLI